MPKTMYRKKSGIKLYSENDPAGEFTDIQRAQGQDVKRSSAPERAAVKKKSGKLKSGQKKTAKKAAKKSAKKSVKKK